jgi:RNA polymerase sigma-70 factor, ECF subfamily
MMESVQSRRNFFYASAVNRIERASSPPPAATELRRLDRVEEKRLLQAARRGDPEAFALLYRAHVQLIFRYISYRVNDTHLAEDLTGDVFIRALESIDRYTDRGRPFAAWLYRIAHARVVDHYRRRGRRPSEIEIEPTQFPVQPDMDGALIRRQAAQTLRAAIAELTGDQQQVIILRFIEGRRIEEVARIMGRKANAVKALQHRALRALASRLERSGFQVDEILSGIT